MESPICPLDFRYGRSEMKAIFGEERRILYQMKVEAALAKAHAAVGTVSKEDAREIARVASLDVVKIERIRDIEKETNHDIMAMVKAMTEQCSGDAGKYVHLGATSNDIVDTATALQIKDALNIIKHDLDDLLFTFAKVAKRERDTMQIGRTHAQFAIPITFGFKIAGYIAEILRHEERLFEITPRACAGKMTGSVGTGAAMGKNSGRIQLLVMQELFLTFEPAATQVVGRDRYTELICFLANIATSLERFATEIRNLQRSEINEVAEPFDVKTQVGSSTMAQKKNPINSENITGLARVIRGFVIPTFENQVLWHERDLSNSSGERFTLPHVFILLDEILRKADMVFSGLEINADRMMKNIESSKGLIMAEPVMMKLTEKGLGRQEAHEILRESSMAAIQEGTDLKDVLMKRPDVRRVLSEEELISVMDPANYTGNAKETTDKMVLAAEEMLGKKV